MLEPRESFEPRATSRGIRPFHGIVVLGAVVVCVVVAFAALSFIAGAAWTVVKIVVICAVVYGVARLVLRSARR